MSNPYQSPSSEASAAQPKKKRGSVVRSIVAVLVGGLIVDLSGTIIVGTTVSLVTLWVLDLDENAVRAWIHALGVLCSFLGGLTAASIAGRRHLLHAILSTSVAHIVFIPELANGTFFRDPTRWLTITLCFVAAAAAGRLCAVRDSQRGDNDGELENCAINSQNGHE